MAVTPDKVQIGSSNDYLDGVAVDTAAGTGLFRETVVAADPENGEALARVRNDAPAADDYGSVVRVAGQVNTGLQQPTTPTDTQPVSEAANSIIAKAVNSAASGLVTIATPTAGKAIRLWWYNIGAHPLNSAPVVVGLRFGAAGIDFYQTALSQYGAATAHSFKSGKSYVQGAVNQPLVLNKDVAQQVYVNIDYEEVTP